MSTAAVRQYTVTADWDAEAGVFYVVKSDIPGLWLEDANWSDFCEAIFAAAPELILANLDGGLEPEADLPIHVMASAMQTLRLPR